MADNPLWKAERVENYLGLPGVTGPELLGAFRRHALGRRAGQPEVDRERPDSLPEPRVLPPEGLRIVREARAQLPEAVREKPLRK